MAAPSLGSSRWDSIPLAIMREYIREQNKTYMDSYKPKVSEELNNIGLNADVAGLVKSYIARIQSPEVESLVTFLNSKRYYIGESGLDVVAWSTETPVEVKPKSNFCCTIS
jgi:hypothetical protein